MQLVFRAANLVFTSARTPSALGEKIDPTLFMVPRAQMVVRSTSIIRVRREGWRPERTKVSEG